MNVPINKNIEEINESVAMGFSAKEVLYVIIGLTLGIVNTLVIQQFLGLNAAVYLSIPVVSPVIALGFYKPNGMTFKELMHAKKKVRINSKPLEFVSDENMISIKKALIEDKEKVLNENTSEAKRMMKKFKIYAVIFVVLFATIMITIALLK